MLYADQKELFNKLPDDKAGELIKHIFSYINDDNPITKDILIEIAFESIKQQLKRDLKKWEARAENSRLNGLKGGRPKEPKKPSGLIDNPTEPKEPVKDNVNVNVTVNDNVKDKVILKEKVYSDEIKNFTHSILKQFPIQPKKIEEWYKVTDQLINLDKYNYDSILLIVETFTKDEFWAKNFQSYTKLRKKNKDDIKYIDYFKNTLIAEKNGKAKRDTKEGCTWDELAEVLKKHEITEE